MALHVATASRRLIKNGALSLAVVLSSGCSRATWQAVAAGMAAAGGSGTPAYSATSRSSAYLLFGGPGHKTYLGCLCGQYGSESILNPYSRYGSAYSTTSIFNHYGDFGSKYSTYSPCNPYASDPPVLVTGGGAFIGRLTLNRFAPGALTDQKVLGWLAAVCSS